MDSDELVRISLCPGWEDNIMQLFSTLLGACENGGGMEDARGRDGEATAA